MRLRTLPALFAVLSVPALAADGFDEFAAQGRAAFLASDLDRAESAYNQACPAELVGTYPVSRAVACEDLLASVDEARGNPARAEQRYLRAVAGAELAGVAYRPLYCARLIDLGEHYHRQGQSTEAEANLLKALELARTLTGVKPELLIEALSRLGGMYSDNGQPERGRAPLTEALKMAAAPELAARLAPELAFARDSLGMIELAAGHQREAESNLREAVAIASSALGEDHPVTAMYQTNLALALMMDRQFSRAGLLLRRAQFVIENRQGKNAPGLGIIYAELSTAASGEGKLTQAADFAQRAISILNLQRRLDARALSIAQVTLAGAYLRQHNTSEAEKLLPEAVEMQRKVVDNPNTLAAAIQLLAQLRTQQHNWHAAEALYREAIGIYESRAAAETNPGAAPALRALADLLKHNGGSKEEVRALETRARAIQQTATQAGRRA